MNLDLSQRVLEEIQRQIGGNPVLPEEKLEAYINSLSEGLVTIKNAKELIDEGNRLEISIDELDLRYDETLATKIMLEDIKCDLYHDLSERLDHQLAKELSQSGNRIAQSDNALFQLDDIQTDDSIQRVYSFFSVEQINKITTGYPPNTVKLISLDLIVKHLNIWSQKLVYGRVWDEGEMFASAQAVQLTGVELAKRNAYVIFAKAYINWSPDYWDILIDQVWELDPLYYSHFAILLTEISGWNDHKNNGLSECINRLNQINSSWPIKIRKITTSFLDGLIYLRTFISDAELIHRRWYKLAHYPLTKLQQIHDYIIDGVHLSLPKRDIKYLDKIGIKGLNRNN